MKPSHPRSGHTDREVPLESLLPELRARDERLAALKSLAGKMAHDFNNYLVPLLGYMSLIKEEVAPASTATQYLQTMEDSARKTESLLDVMLLALRPQRRCSPKPIDLKQIAECELAGFQASLPEVVPIAISTEMESAPILADETHWTQVFRHLLSNARFALALGGKLRLTIGHQKIHARRRAELGVTCDDVYTIVLMDSGIGMNATIRDHVFEPFFTTRPKGQALGLGLTMVHSVAQLHGGQIMLESEEDQGTTVHLWVPSAGMRAKEHPTAAVAPAPSQKPLKHGKVLLVEDDSLVREVIKTYLERIPVSVILAQDGLEALKAFRHHRSELALVLTDITMPNMDGVELCLKLRELDPHARVVLMSGNAAAMQDDSLDRLGKDRPVLLRKPFTFRQFVEVVRAELGR